MPERTHRAYAWGRIASLPFAIVLEVCARLRRGDNTTDILAWLNVFAHGTQNRRYRFGRSPISSFSLSKFKRRVYPIYERHLAQLGLDATGLPSAGSSLRSTNRTGKIARLPHAIRSEVNRRLLDGQPGGLIVAWLNAEPAVAARMRLHFGGHPISEQNLSTWRIGGFKDYLRDLGRKSHA